MDIKGELFKLRDLKYKEFNQSLIPTVDPDTVIGVRTPQLRALAKKLKGKEKEFLAELPHEYYEENNLHAYVICEIDDYKECIKRINEFLPFVDNWATCDGMRPKSFKKNKDELYGEILRWLSSDKTFTVRFAILMLMTYYLDDGFLPEHLGLVADVDKKEYYVQMMQAWYFATAMAKRWEETVWLLENKKLSVWVHNKAIQKAIESYRISDDKKQYLKTLKIKN